MTTMNQKDKLLRSLHLHDRYARNCKERGGPEILVKQAKKHLDNKLAECRAAGITDEDYREFCKTRDIQVCIEQLEDEYQDHCLTCIRFQQQQEKNNIDTLDAKYIDTRFANRLHLVCDMPLSQSCGPFCPKFLQATEEQVRLSLDAIDIDTKESIN